jgi:ribosomal protein S18 acetylase RimI-like enzyme
VLGRREAIAGRRRREAEPRVVQRDAAVAVAQALDDLAVQQRVGRVAVQQQQRRALALVDVVHARAVDVEEAAGEGKQPLSEPVWARLVVLAHVGAMMAHVEVERATAADVPRLAEVLGRAFADDPLNRHLVPDDARRAKVLPGSFAGQLRHVFLPRGTVLTTPDRAGAALWLGPGAQRLSLGQQLRLMPGMIRLVGLWRMAAAMRSLAELDRRVPAEPHWHLSVLGVARERRGRGIGSALLAPVLERCDRELVPAYLETANRANLPLYERHGFSVREQVELRDGLRLWTMLRLPRR